MTPRRLPLRPDSFALQRPLLSELPTGFVRVGWTRKTFAAALHLTCLSLFALVVVWPVVSPIASGELAREFAPVLRALAAWSAKLPSVASLLALAH